MATKPRIFLDTSAIFAGIWSETGGGRMLLRLGEAGAIVLLTSLMAVEELEGAFRAKAPRALGTLALVFDRARVEVTGHPSGDLRTRADRLVDHPGDAQILASAWEADVDFFVSLDRKHFVDNQRPVEEVPFRVGTPGDCLAWIRERMRDLADPPDRRS